MSMITDTCAFFGRGLLLPAASSEQVQQRLELDLVAVQRGERSRAEHRLPPPDPGDGTARPHARGRDRHAASASRFASSTPRRSPDCSRWRCRGRRPRLEGPWRSPAARCRENRFDVHWQALRSSSSPRARRGCESFRTACRWRRRADRRARSTPARRRAPRTRQEGRRGDASGGACATPPAANPTPPVRPTTATAPPPERPAMPSQRRHGASRVDRRIGIRQRRRQRQAELHRRLPRSEQRPHPIDRPIGPLQLLTSRRVDSQPRQPGNHLHHIEPGCGLHANKRTEGVSRRSGVVTCPSSRTRRSPDAPRRTRRSA